MPRYAVLYHRLPDDSPRPTHWDFLLQQGDILRAWALAEPPAADIVIAAVPLPDHRLLYLDYEGPISRNRGHVTRWDSGTCHWLNDTGDEITVRLHGRRLVGQVLLRRSDASGGRWQCVYRPAPDNASS
jgi:hypothetical protein